MEILKDLLLQSGFANMSWKAGLMIIIGLALIYLGIFKKTEPLLLIPIGFGAIIANLPLSGLNSAPNGVFYLLYKYGIETELLPIFIFLGIGAMTDFGPLIANPWTILMGAAAQLGIFIAFLFALLLGFNLKEATAIGVIGGAMGPISISTAVKMAPRLLAPIAVAAYTYMSLVPIIQPPMMKLLTTKKERQVRMQQIRNVSRTEKIAFTIIVTVVTGLLVPSIVPLLGFFMLGNIFKESGVVDRLSDTAANEFMNVNIILLASTIGSTMQGETFLTLESLKIIGLGIVAFEGGTIGGILLGKLFYWITGGKVNPLIGSAGVAAIPMAARVSQKVAQEEDPGNFLLMHAMGPNVAGSIATAIVAGLMITMLT